MKKFFAPTDCVLCYVGRMAIFCAVGVALGEYVGIWSAAPLVLVALIMTGLKWIVTRYTPE